MTATTDGQINTLRIVEPHVATLLVRGAIDPRAIAVYAISQVYGTIENLRLEVDVLRAELGEFELTSDAIADADFMQAIEHGIDDTEDWHPDELQIFLKG